jgi:hypothetical protein
LALRFEKSRHLDTSQKQKYFTDIQKIKRRLKIGVKTSNEKSIPRSYEKILGDLKLAMNSNNTVEANRIIEELEQSLSRETRFNNIFTFTDFYWRIYDKNPRAAITSLILIVALYLYIIVFTDIAQEFYNAMIQIMRAFFAF